MSPELGRVACYGRYSVGSSGTASLTSQSGQSGCIPTWAVYTLLLLLGIDCLSAKSVGGGPMVMGRDFPQAYWQQRLAGTTLEDQLCRAKPMEQGISVAH